MLPGGARPDPGVEGGASVDGVLTMNLIDLDGFVELSIGVLV